MNERNPTHTCTVLAGSQPKKSKSRKVEKSYRNTENKRKEANSIRSWSLIFCIFHRGNKKKLCSSLNAESCCAVHLCRLSVHRKPKTTVHCSKKPKVFFRVLRVWEIPVYKTISRKWNANLNARRSTLLFVTADIQKHFTLLLRSCKYRFPHIFGSPIFFLNCALFFCMFFKHRGAGNTIWDEERGRELDVVQRWRDGFIVFHKQWYY